MILHLVRDLTVDPYNVPDDFDDQVKKTFSEFTEGTVDDYMFEDQLYFIDLCVHSMHGNVDDNDGVMNCMKGYLEYEVKDLGEIPDEDDYLTLGFMEICYQAGKESQRMCSHDFVNCHSRHDEEVIEKVLIRIIKAVLDYEKE